MVPDDPIAQALALNHLSTTDQDLSSIMCLYKSKKCHRPRAVRKGDGLVLQLCEFHRAMQNQAKKRSDMKLKIHRATQRRYRAQAMRQYQLARLSGTISPTFKTKQLSLVDWMWATLTAFDTSSEMIHLEPLPFDKTDLLKTTPSQESLMDDPWNEEDIQMLLYFSSD